MKRCSEINGALFGHRKGILNLTTGFVFDRRQDYWRWRVFMKGKMSTDMGNIVIDRDVLAKYAGTATMECIGIVGMAALNVKDGVARLLKKENAGRGVNVFVVNNKLKIELHVVVAYGVSIRAVAQNVLENVRYKIEQFTGLGIESISVIVEGVRIMDED